jgi:hypothetical protein
MAVLKHAVENWTDVDAYCLLHGFDPLEIPTRRLVAAAWTFLIKDMDPETIDTLILNLNTTEYTKPIEIASPSPTDTDKTVVANSRWKAPEGWTPPGWDEEKSYQAATSFMTFNANPK